MDRLISKGAESAHEHWIFEEAQRLSKIGSYKVNLANAASSWSRQSAVNFGLPPETPMNAAPLDTLIHVDDRQALREEWDRSIREKTDFSAEYRIIRPNGELAIISGRGTILLDAQGNALKIIGTLQDVTELRLAQQKIKEKEAQLIHNSRLSALGEMAAGMAHEINNPLTVILARAVQCQKILQDPLKNSASENLLQYQETIVKMVRRIESVIKNLRLFSNSGQNSENILVQVNQIVEEAIMLCRHEFHEDRVEFRFESAPADLLITCHDFKIAQILVNLLKNAHDAVLEQSEKWVELRIEATSSAIQFKVLDSGPGVPLAIRGKIMDPFFSTKNSKNSMGLGLSISNALAKDHGGRLYLDNESPYTCFVLELPRTSAAANST